MVEPKALHAMFQTHVQSLNLTPSAASEGCRASGLEGEARLSLDDGEREIVVPVGALETYNLAWTLTVHRAQGSQFPAVVAPWSTAYAVMLSRALLYTAVTRAQRLCVLVGERKAVAIAVARAEQRRRHSALAERIVEDQGVNPRSADAP
jgi:ATP-dependent exoDNAse (exonuclease V) alpha subunit